MEHQDIRQSPDGRLFFTPDKNLDLTMAIEISRREARRWLVEKYLPVEFHEEFALLEQVVAAGPPPS
jgi:hypothetical protein